MTENMIENISVVPTVFVAAAVLLDTEGRVLLARRPEGKPLAGLWEFPGGKIRDNERPVDALVRELKEELSLDVAPEDLFPLTFGSYSYPDFHLFMPLFGCRIWKGSPRPLEGQELVWIDKGEWTAYPMPLADEQVLPILTKLI